MKRRISLLSLSIIVLILSIFTQGTFAWFTDTAYRQKIFEIADISYTYSGTLVQTGDNEIVVPGQPLITSGSLFLTNKSKIDTNLRVQIEFSYTDQVTHEVIKDIYTGSGNEGIDSFMSIQMVSSWEYDSADKCWHYKYNDNSVIPASATPEGYSFNMIDTLQFDGDKVDIGLAGAIFNITLVFQAKQSNFVDWQTIGTQEITDLLGG